MISIPLGKVARAIEASWTSSDFDQRVERVVIDSREVQTGDLFFAIRGDRLDGHDFIIQAIKQGALACVVDCKWDAQQKAQQAQWGVPLLVVENTVAALGQLAGYYRRMVMSTDTVVIAVTGSNGKTTTKQMIDQVLCDSLVGRASPKSFNNQYGVPLTILSCENDDRYLIVEIGSNSPGEIAALNEIVSPDYGVITSIGEAHLEGLGDIDSVAREKSSLLRNLHPEGWAIINIDREEILPYIENQDDRNITTFGFCDSADHRIQMLRSDIYGIEFDLDEQYRIELSFPGEHHAYNATAAFFVARRLGIPPETIIDRLSSIQPSDGRARVIELDDITLVDDTYNANPTSVSAAIETLSTVNSGRRMFVLGDMLELGTASLEIHRKIIHQMVESEIEIIVTVGELSSRAAGDLQLQSDHSRIIRFSNAADVCNKIHDLLRSGDTIWLKGSRAIGLECVVESLQDYFHMQAVNRVAVS